jgi:hypothetical protein
VFAKLDFSQPVGVLCVCALHFVPDAEKPHPGRPGGPIPCMAASAVSRDPNRRRPCASVRLRAGPDLGGRPGNGRRPPRR